MIIYFNLNDEGYVDGWGSTRSNDDEIELEIDKEHEFFNSDPYAWKFVDEKLVFDEVKQQELIDEYERKKNKLSAENINALAILELAEQLELLKGGN